jgi:hypothetical protein
MRCALPLHSLLGPSGASPTAHPSSGPKVQGPSNSVESCSVALSPPCGSGPSPRNAAKALRLRSARRHSARIHPAISWKGSPRLAAAQVPSSLACGGTTAPRSTSIPGPKDLRSLAPSIHAHAGTTVRRAYGPLDLGTDTPTRLTRRGAQMRAKCAQIQRFARRLALLPRGRTANHRLRSPRTRCASRDGGRGSALRGHSFLMSLVVSPSTSRPTRLSHRLLRAAHNRSLC